MNSFRTEIHLKKQKFPIDYKSRIFTLGSCFSEHMSGRLRYFKFETLNNPFGISFHPKAVERILRISTVKEKKYTDKDVFFLNEQWHCFDFHSDLSHPDKTKALQQMNAAVATAKAYLQKTSHMIITLGTAWVYELNETGQAVANCHKVPQTKFTKKLLSPSEIIESLEKTVKSVQLTNPNVVFIFTVSPVRHLKDGIVENQRSKAHLITAIASLVEKHKTAFYMPSYEIMMDDLRDYRFYESDMIHPNQTAVAYIWNRFKKAWIDQKCYAPMEEIDSIRKGLAHKTSYPDSKQYQKFLATLHKKIQTLKEKYAIEF